MSKRIAVESFYDELLTLQGYEEHEKVAFLGRIAGGFDRLRGATRGISSAMKQQAGALKKGPGMQVDTLVRNPGGPSMEPIFETAKRQVGGLQLGTEDLRQIRGADDLDNLSPALKGKLEPFVPEGKSFADIEIGTLVDGKLQKQTLGKIKEIDTGKIEDTIFNAQLTNLKNTAPDLPALKTFDDQINVSTKAQGELTQAKEELQRVQDALAESIDSAIVNNASLRNAGIAKAGGEDALKAQYATSLGKNVDSLDSSDIAGLEAFKNTEILKQVKRSDDLTAQVRNVLESSDAVQSNSTALETARQQVDQFTQEATRAASELETTRASLKTLMTTLDDADKMKNTKAEIMSASKVGFFDNQAAMKKRVDNVLKTSGLDSVIKVDDYTPEGLNNAMAKLDSLETSTRTAANEAVKDLKDFQMTGRIGGELEDYVRMNPNIAMENLSPEQINTLAKIRGLEAISDLVEPVTMGAATAGVGLAGLGGAYLGASAIDKLLG